MRKKSLKTLLCLLIVMLSINGCIAAKKTKPSSAKLLIEGSLADSYFRHYIRGVPFVKQKGNLCGPAALSSVFQYYGRAISQEDIARSIYLIPVHGVLNIDLEAYAREKGFWTHVSYNEDPAEIKRSVRRGVPALVLTTVSGILFKKSYHYLLVLGYDDNERIFIAHSGKKANEPIPYDDFLKNWTDAECWSMIACPKERVTWELDAEGYGNLGVLYENENDLDNAVQAYRKSLDKSWASKTLFNLGNAHLKNKQLNTAVSYYRQALEIDPGFADCYNNLAYTYMEKDVNLDEAIGYVKEALRLKPANRAYYLDTLGMIQLKKDLLKEAIRSFEEASELATNKEMGSIIYYHLGMAKLKAGLRDEAKESLRKSLELNPDSEAKETLMGLL